MKCHVCGSEMNLTATNLPFKVNALSIVILKDLPVWQCGSCSEFLISDSVMSRIEKIFKKVDAETELEIVRYAA